MLMREAERRRGGEAEQVGVKRVRKNTYRRVAVCVLFRDHRMLVLWYTRAKYMCAQTEGKHARDGREDGEGGARGGGIHPVLGALVLFILSSRFAPVLHFD